jgi:ubiquinone/menaquinone biosynthesis C-methylase UbiE
MNRIHHWYCSSSRWRRTLERQVFPRVFRGINLGNDVLEIGPGPGLTTELLRKQCERLTCLEIDPVLATPLRQRMQNTNVTVVDGDATRMNFADQRFSAAVSLTMLHHVPSSALQSQLFAEVYRVLRPGGVFVGMDARDTWGLRLIHWGDTLVSLDPNHLQQRLLRTGFSDVLVEAERRAFRFVARRPA